MSYDNEVHIMSQKCIKYNVGIVVNTCYLDLRNTPVQSIFFFGSNIQLRLERILRKKGYIIKKRWASLLVIPIDTSYNW